MDSLRSQILGARRPVEAQEQAGRIAPGGSSPFGTLSKSSKRSPKKPGRHVVQEAHRWADSLLRDSARRHERAILAIRDAARQLEAKGGDPKREELYVASSIRQAWNLSPDQLSKALKQLEKHGAIEFTHQRRGRHARFRLLDGPFSVT